MHCRSTWGSLCKAWPLCLVWVWYLQLLDNWEKRLDNEVQNKTRTQEDTLESASLSSGLCPQWHWWPVGETSYVLHTFPCLRLRKAEKKSDGSYRSYGGLCDGSVVKNLLAKQETQVWPLHWEDPLEESMATHSSILAWRILRTEEPGWLQSRGSHRAEHDWSDWAAAAAAWELWARHSSHPRADLTDYCQPIMLL